MDVAGQGKGPPVLAVSVCLRAWEMVVFLRDGSGSVGERRAELVRGTSREVPRLLCHVK